MDLLLYACLIAAPAECRTERLSFSVELVAPQACMIGAQAALAQWTAAHPKWRVERFRCVPAGWQPGGIEV